MVLAEKVERVWCIAWCYTMVFRLRYVVVVVARVVVVGTNRERQSHKLLCISTDVMFLVDAHTHTALSDVFAV